MPDERVVITAAKEGRSQVFLVSPDSAREMAERLRSEVPS